MKVFPLLFIIASFSLASAAPLFNGTDLAGWKSDAESDFPYWSVRDGLLICQSGPSKKGSHLWTTEEFTDFTLTLDFKYLSGTVDSGVMIRGKHDQIQIGISGSLKRDLTASPYIPKKGYPVEGKEAIAALKPDDWNTLKIEVIGNTYRTWLNGVAGITYTSNTAQEKGPLGLQLHAKNTMTIAFRKIEIEKIEKAEKAK